MENTGHPSKGDPSDVLGAILRELRRKRRSLTWEVGNLKTAPTNTTDLLRIQTIPGAETRIFGYVIAAEEQCNIILTVATDEGVKTMQIPMASDGTIILVIDGDDALNEGWLATGDIVFRPKANASVGKDYQVSALIERRQTS